MFVVVVVVDLEVEVYVGVNMRMQLPMMGLDGLMKEKNLKKKLKYFPTTYKRVFEKNHIRKKQTKTIIIIKEHTQDVVHFEAF